MPYAILSLFITIMPFYHFNMYATIDLSFYILIIGRGDKLENFDLTFFPTSKMWKWLLTTN